MSDAPLVELPPRRPVRQVVRELANPATVKGLIAVVGGLLVVVLPEISLVVVEYAFGVALMLSGGYDAWYGLSGRSLRASGSRVMALLRGLAGVLVGLLVLLAPKSTLDVVVVLAGFYLLARGAIYLVGSAFAQGRPQRIQRLTAGFAASAFGVLSLAVPTSLVEGVVLSAAVVAIIVGGVVLAYGVRAAGPEAAAFDVPDATIPAILWDWVNENDIGAARRESLSDTLHFDGPDARAKLTAWWTMLILSVAIATFAVLQDSTAVVIGAMLIAPLMTPILGLAGAVVNGWRHRAGASALLVAMGVAAAISLAYLLASWVPQLVAFDANTQISSRTSPTFIDMLIAIAAGAAGAFATVNSRVASSIAGVAIAVALVPPLSVVGVALESERWADALGAFVLFMTNFVSIVLAAAAVFVLTGFAEAGRLRTNGRQIVSTLAPFGALAMVILVPLVFTAEGILADSSRSRAAQDEVQAWLEGVERIQVDLVSVDEDEVLVALSGSQRPPSPAVLQRQLSDALGGPVALVLEYTPTQRVDVSESGEVSREGG